MKVLIIDDEELIRGVIKEYCLNENYQVREAGNGLEALDILKKEKVDAIVLDIMMPKMDGYTFFKEMKENYQIPTIVVSARSDEYDKLHGFELGIDDYLTKPFHMEELVARVNILLRNENNLIKDYIEVGDLRLNLKTSSLICTKTNEKIDIVCKEFQLLEYLMNNKNQIISKDNDT